MLLGPGHHIQEAFTHQFCRRLPIKIHGSVALPTSTRHIPNSICFAPSNQDTPCSQNYGFACFCNALGLAVLWTPSQANVFQKGHGTIGVPTVPWFGRFAFLIFHIAGPHSLGTWSWEPGLIIFPYRWGRIFISLFSWTMHQMFWGREGGGGKKDGEEDGKGRQQR